MEIIPAACLAIATIVGEAGAEPYAGKLAVAKVIRNRMAQKFFSDGSVAGTVLRPLQFSLWNTSTPARSKVCQISSDETVAVESARAWDESEHSWPASFGDEEAASRILLYHADYLKPKPDWAKIAHFVTKINRHLFYENR